jgi:hypothetical protein
MALFICLSDCIDEENSDIACEQKQMLDGFIVVKNKAICRLIDHIRNFLMKPEEDKAKVPRGHV